MVKSTAQESMVTLEEYPCIMQSVESGDPLLVLFCAKSTGTVLVADKFYRVGTHHGQWGMEFFKPYRGTVTLES